jgi:hypothetical protein
MNPKAYEEPYKMFKKSSKNPKTNFFKKTLEITLKTTFKISKPKSL